MVPVIQDLLTIGLQLELARWFKPLSNGSIGQDLLTIGLQLESAKWFKPLDNGSSQADVLYHWEMVPLNQVLPLGYNYHQLDALNHRTMIPASHDLLYAPSHRQNST